LRPRKLAVAAGIPDEIGREFVAQFRELPILSWLPLAQSRPYTDEYSKKLYDRVAGKLQDSEESDRCRLLENVNFILLYIRKDDGSEAKLLKRFETEAFTVPLKWPEGANLSIGNPRRRAVKSLVREGRRAVRSARKLLSVIAEEVTNRDNKTCLLLPPRNFGRDIQKVFDCVHDAASTGKEGVFKERLDRISQSLDKHSEGRRKYFVGQGGLVFKSPGKARARHAVAPVWGDSDHDSSCVLRGRIRFGVSYDPKFHYDCEISGRNRRRNFPSCHDTKEVSRGRSHVNVAPNDNIR